MSDINGVLALEVSDLVKHYGNITVVDGISLRIPPGQVFGILGPNGAGKSTTIKMISGLLKADGGSIRIFGVDSHSGSMIKMVGLCPQELVVWDGLTLMEQLVFAAEMYDIPRKAVRERAEELLDKMGLADKKNKLASTLSGGMKRRLNILLAVMHDPSIVILDEPQAGLDPQSRLLVREHIKGLADKGKTVIITTHDMEEADKVIDRAAIIDGGKIIAQDTPERLKKKLFGGDLLEFTITDLCRVDNGLGDILEAKFKKINFFGNNVRIESEKPLDAVKELEEILGGLKVQMEDIKIRKGTLEDVFISLTGRGLRE